MADLFDDTLKRGERYPTARLGKGSAESIKPYGEKKKSKSNDANRYSYPYAYRRPKGSTSLQVLRRHRPDELQGMSNFTAILYYFVGTFWCLFLSFLLWLHIYADPVHVEQIVRGKFKGEDSTLRQLNIYAFVEKSGVTEEKTSYVKTLLGKKAMERLLVHTKGNVLSGNCVVINLLHINDKITSYGTVVQGNSIDYSQVSRAMNMLAPMCIEKCNNTDGWIDDFEDEILDGNGPSSNGSLDSIDIETRELGKVTAYYKNSKNGFDIGRLIAQAYNCTQEALINEQSPATVRLRIYECARSTAKTALHEFIRRYGKNSNGYDYDITHATVCVAGTIMKKEKEGPPTGINPLNIAVACSDNKRNNKFVLGIPVSLVWQDSEGGIPKVLTFFGSGGYSVLERTIRRILIFTWVHGLDGVRGYPETYYDPFSNRTIVDDISSAPDQLLEQEESALLSGLSLHERIHHMSHLLAISGTGVYDENEVYADEEGCFYNCTYRFPSEFTEVPSENDNAYFY